MHGDVRVNMLGYGKRKEEEKEHWGDCKMTGQGAGERGKPGLPGAGRARRGRRPG